MPKLYHFPLKQISQLVTTSSSVKRLIALTCVPFLRTNYFRSVKPLTKTSEPQAMRNTWFVKEKFTKGLMPFSIKAMLRVLTAKNHTSDSAHFCRTRIQYKKELKYTEVKKLLLFESRVGLQFPGVLSPQALCDSKLRHSPHKLKQPYNVPCMLPTILSDSFELRQMKDSFLQSERQPHQETPNFFIYKKHGIFVIG